MSLFEAVEQGDIERAAVLLKGGLDINSVNPEVSLTVVSFPHSLPQLISAFFGLLIHLVNQNRGVRAPFTLQSPTTTWR